MSSKSEMECPLYLHGESFRVVSAAAADFAGDVDVREEIHFDAAEAVALAGFAAAAFYVEAEAAGAVAALAGFGELGEEFADGGEDAGVGGGVGSRRAADGGLVDFDDFVDLVGALDFAELAGALHRAVEGLRQGAIENVVHQGGFSGAGYAGDYREQAERQFQVDIFQVVGFAAEDAEEFSVGRAALGGHGDGEFAAEVTAGEGIGVVLDFLGVAFGDQVAAGVSGAGAEVDDVVGAADGFFVVLDDQDGVAHVAELLERGDQASVVAGVQADGGLVKDVKDAAKLRADLRGQSDALGFAAGKRGRGAVQAEVPEADGEQKIEARGNFGQGASSDGGLPLGQAFSYFIYRGAGVGNRAVR